MLNLLYQGHWFTLPRENLTDWLMLLLLYPLLSVIPQELIFRTYFFHRYKRIMPSKWLRIIISASVFALAHIVYANWVAVSLAFIGGLLFAYTYAQSRSTFACVLEHSLWGIWMFTLGMGILITYASYISKKDDIVGSAKMVAITDSLVAFVAGLMVLPAIFSFDPNTDPASYLTRQFQ